MYMYIYKNVRVASYIQNMQNLLTFKTLSMNIDWCLQKQ